MGATKTITSKPKTKVDEHHHEHHDESFIPPTLWRSLCKTMFDVSD